MADIRINALATTAASTASDDFIAIDGSANGTRKLNAYSPTFGGNLTVSGTGTSSVAGNAVIGGTTQFDSGNNLNLRGSTAGLSIYNSRNGSSNNWSIIQNTSTIGQSNLVFITGGGTSLTLNHDTSATLAGNLTVSGGQATISSSTTSLLNLTSTGASGKVWLAQSYSDGSFYITHQGVKDAIRCYPTTGNTEIGGNLTVSGTGTSSFAGPAQVAFSVASQPAAGSSGQQLRILNGSAAYGLVGGVDNAGNAFLQSQRVDGTATTYALRLNYNGGEVVVGGNLLIGTTTDAGYKLVVKGASDGQMQLDVASGSPYTSLYWSNAGTNKALAFYNNSAGEFAIATLTAGNQLVFRSGANTTALTLDSSQNATFAGTVTSTGTLKAVTNLALTTVSGYNFIGFNNANNLTTATGIYSATGDTTLYLNVPTSSTIRARINGVDKLTVSETTATFANSIAIGNTVQTAASVASTHKVTISIGGTTYYLLATNV